MARSSTTKKLMGAVISGAVGYMMVDVVDQVINMVPLPDTVKQTITGNAIVKGVIAIIAASFVGPTVASFVSRGAKSWAELAAVGGAIYRLVQEGGLKLPFQTSTTMT